MCDDVIGLKILLDWRTFGLNCDLNNEYLYSLKSL